MASLTRWTWVWVNSGSWWWTGRPGVLQFMGSWRVGHDWTTELNWTELIAVFYTSDNFWCMWAIKFTSIYFFLLNCQVKVKVKSLSHAQLFATAWTVACQAPLSMGFSRKEYWSGLPFPSPGDLPNPGIEPRSPALQADALSLAFYFYKCISLYENIWEKAISNYLIVFSVIFNDKICLIYIHCKFDIYSFF